MSFFSSIVDSRDNALGEAVTNDSDDAILAMVPAPLHKYLTPHTRNHTTSGAGVVSGAGKSQRCLGFLLQLSIHILKSSSLAPEFK